MTNGSESGMSFGRLKQVGIVVVLAVLALIGLRFLLPFAGAFLRVALIPVVLAVAIGVPLGVAYLFSSTEQLYDASTTGSKTRSIDEKAQLSPDTTCYVCGASQGGGVRRHEYTEWVLRGHPMVEQNHKSTVYCDKHYNELDRLHDLNRQFDHERNAELQKDILDDK